MVPHEGRDNRRKWPSVVKGGPPEIVGNGGVDAVFRKEVNNHLLQTATGRPHEGRDACLRSLRVDMRRVGLKRQVNAFEVISQCALDYVERASC
jgi:hypothetical protein